MFFTCARPAPGMQLEEAPLAAASTYAELLYKTNSRDYLRNFTA